MSIKMEKSLAEAAWKKFSKGLPKELELDDGALLKALAKLDKAGANDKPDELLAALGDVETQLKKQHAQKRKVDTKDLRKQLDEMLDAVTRQRKEAQAVREAAGDDEEESPTLLTSKMAPLVRQLRKGEAEQLRMSALICTAGKETAVLIMRKAISPARRKLLSDALGVKGGAKFIAAECGFEQGVLTFVVGAPGAALAKRLRQALLEQIEMRLKVRVRGEDGTVEEDGEDSGDEQSGPQGAAAGVQQAVAAPEIPGRAAAAEPPPAQAAYQARWADLQAKLAAALRDRHPESTKLRALSGFASEKAAAGDHAGAGKALDMLEKFLSAAPAAATAPAAASVPPPARPSPPAPAGASPATMFNARLAALMPRIKTAMAAGGPQGTRARELAAEAGAQAQAKALDRAQLLLDELETLLEGPAAPTDESDATRAAAASSGGGIVQLQKSRLAWDGLRKRVQGQLKGLERTMIDRVREHNASPNADFGYDEGAVASGVRELYGVLDKLDGRLIDILDDALNADGEERRRLQARALELVAEYRQVVDTDSMISKIDDNGFFDTSIRSDAQRTLDQLAAQL
ncbi:MAG TPA: hypothetical protein VLA16_04105 [Ideonella sp.]|nr:hypothetical protein [Ideonella sp.]